MSDPRLLNCFLFRNVIKAAGRNRAVIGIVFGYIWMISGQGSKKVFYDQKAWEEGTCLDDKSINRALDTLISMNLLIKTVEVYQFGKRRQFQVDTTNPLLSVEDTPLKGVTPTRGEGYTLEGGRGTPLKGVHKYIEEYIDDQREAEHKKSDFLTSINKVKSQHEELNEFDSDKLADFIVSHLANKPRKIVDLDAFMYEVMTTWTGARRAALKPTNLKPANDRIKKKTNYDLKVAYKA